MRDLVTQYATLVANLALFLTVFLVALLVPNRQPVGGNRERLYSVLLGLLIGGGIVLTLHLSFEVAEGVFTDLRTLPAVLSGLLGGPIAAAIAAVVGAIGRWSMGGAGWISGVINILIPCGMGALLWYRRAKQLEAIKRWQLVGAVLLSGGLAIPVALLTIPSAASWELSAWSRLVALPTLVNAVVMGLMGLSWEISHRVMQVNTLLQTKVIDGQKQLEESQAGLQQNIAELELSLYAAKLGSWSWNPITGETRMDKRWCEILGYAEGELWPQADSWTSRIHPDDLNRCLDQLSSHLHGETEYYECIYRMRHKDGRWITIKDTGRVMQRDEAGRATRFVGSHQDLSEILAERGRADRFERQVSDITSAGRIGLFRHDVANDLIECNDVFREIFDLPQADYPVLKIAHIDLRYHPDFDQKYVAERSMARSGASQITLNRALKLSDGKLKYVQMICQIERDADQVSVVSGSVLDQTELIVHQELLQSTLKEKQDLLMRERLERKRDQIAIELGYGFKWEFDLNKGMIRPDATMAKWVGRSWKAGNWYPAEEIILAVPEQWRAWVGQTMLEQRNLGLSDPERFILNLQYPLHRADIDRDVWLHAFAKAIEIDGSVIMVGQCLDITEAHEQRELLLYQAQHDGVTGLQNRDRCLEALAQAYSDGVHNNIGILKVGINQFRHLNNVFGSEFGDRMLQGVRDVLEREIPHNDGIYRAMGGNFVIVIWEDATTELLSKLAYRLFRWLNASNAFESNSLPEGISIGGYLVESSSDPERWLQNAQIALAQAKATPSENYCLYTPEMGERLDRYMLIRDELKHAISNQQFELYYQPKFSLRKRVIVGAEALLRWHHPEKGVVSPAEFIPVAEEAGLIPEITRWVLKEACAQAVAWQMAGHSIPVAVNISARHFETGTVEADVDEALLKSGLDPEFLELELTESALLDSSTGVRQVLERWHDRGIRTSIDDFGTGYSNLAYLAELPIDTLKIDQSLIREFVQNKARRVVVQTTIIMARTLKMKTVAEGVESQGVADALTALGCDSIQGYLISKPLPVADFDTQFLDQIGAPDQPAQPERPEELDQTESSRGDQFR